MCRITGDEQEVSGFVRLSGGANMESSSFDFGGRGYVLRRAPSPEMMVGRPFGHDVEAALVRTARLHGVMAPEITGELTEGDSLGSGYIMRRVEAEVSPTKILADPPESLITDIARELALIHRVPVAALSALPVMDTATALAELKKRFLSYGGDRPVLALALRWCGDNIPEAAPPVLVHGDFRIGNIMVDKAGLAVVLDWELAHIGDAHEDLAWGCVGAWRFGHYDKPAFGCADLESYLGAYESAGGCRVDRLRFRFWLIYRTVWWALGCLQMADIWRSGIDRSLERAVIGRRVSENEIDLLMLLEDDAPPSDDSFMPALLLNEPRREGEPSTTELIEAVSEWIETDIKPEAQGRDRFMAAVAMNALNMIKRELTAPVDIHDMQLCDDMLAGKTTLATPGVLTKLRNQLLQKLAIDAPKYAGLAAAKLKWGVANE